MSATPLPDPAVTEPTADVVGRDDDAAWAVLDRPFAGVLLDMDGTLISSVDSVIRSWTTMAREYGIPAVAFDDLHGIPARGIVDRLLPGMSDAEREVAFARVLELELADLEGIAVLPGAMEALSLLAPRGRCAVVTSATRGLAEARLAAAGLPVPAAVVAADDVTHGKPHPEPFLMGAERLGVDPTHCLVVEDASAGIRAARAAGAVAVGLTTTTPGIDADVVVADLAALRFWVDDDDAVRVGPA
ncbi:HAD family hydrolase [Actinotalea ferrariae]|uniref:HAD family hydrolase n=1 Tax=Actinotalea ferrariae TaxID=1386098 RepID=UPI0027DF121D|nr:HAD-IA family hydrolase [Actinotalea ferrariae]